MTDEKAEIINEKDQNEAKGITGLKYLTCQKYGDVFEVLAGLACRHPKVTCKFRLTCPIYSIGKND